jgi:hypothetical protein
MSIDHAVVADIKSSRQNGRLTLAVHVHAGRSRALTWRLWAEVESRGGRTTTQQAGLTNGLQTAPVCTTQFNDDVVGIVELEVSEDNIQLAYFRVPLTG